MRKTNLFLLSLAVSLIFSTQIFAQQHRDIAVVGHNRNNTTALANPAPNSSFSGWAGGNASFNVFTTSPQPLSYLKNKLTGAHLANCNVTLNIPTTPSVIDFDVWGGSADLLFNGQGTFNVTCGATVLAGNFSRAILHVANGSNSAAITLLNNSVTYVAPTNLITNLAGNFAFNQGSLSIGIITDAPVAVSSAGVGSISNFRAYSNIVFGARFIPGPIIGPIEPVDPFE